MRKALLGGSRTVEIECGEFVSLTVKGVSPGTDIKDQKERMAIFDEQGDTAVVQEFGPYVEEDAT